MDQRPIVAVAEAALDHRSRPLPVPIRRARRWMAGRPAAVDAALAGGLAVALLPTTVTSLLALQRQPGWTAPVLAAFAVLHCCPAARRSAPAVGYAVACLAMLVVVAAPIARPTGNRAMTGLGFPMLFLPSSLVFLPVLHGVAAYAGRRARLLSAPVAVLGAGLAMVRVAAVVPAEYPSLQYRAYLTLALLIAVLAAWGLGTASVTRARAHAVERAEATRSAILAERSRIAQDMHDVVAHSVAVIVRLAEAGALVATRSPDRAGQLLVSIADVGRDALTDLRGMVGVLRDPVPHPPDTAGAPGPQPTLAQLPAVLDRVRSTGVDVTFGESGTPQTLGTTAELAAYHVVREALTNTIKHAGAGARARVTLDWLPGCLVVRVEDDGGARGDASAAGRDAARPVPGSGTGLAGLRERVAAAGGTVRAEPLERGFAVQARLPARGGTEGTVSAG